MKFHFSIWLKFLSDKFNLRIKKLVVEWIFIAACIHTVNFPNKNYLNAHAAADASLFTSTKEIILRKYTL